MLQELEVNDLYDVNAGGVIEEFGYIVGYGVSWSVKSFINNVKSLWSYKLHF